MTSRNLVHYKFNNLLFKKLLSCKTLRKNKYSKFYVTFTQLNAIL